MPLRTARLTLKKPIDVIFDYYRILSVAVLENMQYKTLNYEDCSRYWRYALEASEYVETWINE